MMRVMNTGRIEKDDLIIFGGQDAHLAAAGGLRLGSHGRDFLAEESVDERGLAHIGASDNGHKAGFDFSHFFFQLTTAIDEMIRAAPTANCHESCSCRKITPSRTPPRGKT